MDKHCITNIKRIYQAIASLEQQMIERYGLNINEAMLLSTLSEMDCSTSGQLAAILQITPSNMSKVIRSAELKGLIKRAFDKQDKRIIRFSITHNGTQMLDNMTCNDIQLPPLLLQLMEK